MNGESERIHYAKLRSNGLRKVGTNVGITYCIGRPLDERHVHRPEIVARLAEVESDTPMTPEIVARVVAHPRAYLPRFPPGAKRVLYLSKARPEQDRHQAREVFSRVPPGLFSLLAAGDTLSGRVEVYPQPDQ